MNLEKYPQKSQEVLLAAQRLAALILLRQTAGATARALGEMSNRAAAFFGFSSHRYAW